jgi:hypothetical protein
MTSDASVPTPLPGDPARQAIPVLRGYAYQIWHTIDHWISLERGETLFVECAEDIDLARTDGATAIQVKDTSARVSLASKDARDAIIHFWELRERTSGSVRFKFLTSAAIATEQGPLLERRPGIKVWREAAHGNLTSFSLLRQYLIETFAENRAFCTYLQDTPPEKLMMELVQPFEWVMEEPDAETVQEYIRRRLVAHGENHGCSPSHSIRALDSLYRHCWEVAQRKEPRARSLTREDFLLLFDQAVSVLVPMGALLGALSPSSPTTTAITLTGSSLPWTDTIPPLPSPILPRDSAVAAAHAALFQLATLVLTGSAGKGKTTLAKLVASAERLDCYWMDLSGRATAIADSSLSTMAVAISNRSSPCIVVIDDIPIDHGSDQRLWTSLAILQHACKRSDSKVLITTRGVPKARLDTRLLSSGASVQQVEDLSVAEVTQFLEILGCPSNLLSTWARLVFSHSMGHPKLVHVFAVDLRDRGWPRPSHKDVLATPESIAGQRAYERLNVSLRESGPPLDFLYHLTLVVLPFDRSFALLLGSRIDGLPDPGTTLDRFLGLWIEPSYATHFRVTSLLTNEAAAAWPPEKIKEAHYRIYQSFLAGRTINVAHAFEVLTHGLSAQVPGCLMPFLKAMLDTKGPHLPRMAKELRPVVYFGTGVGSRAIPFDIGASLLLRLLQFRIAAREEPGELPRLADEWLWEVEDLTRNYFRKTPEFYHTNRALWASSLALSQESALPPEKILDAILILDNCQGHGIPYSVPASLVRETGTKDLVAHLFSFFDVRCNDISYFDRLLDALTKVPQVIRSRMLAAAQFPQVRAFGFLVDKAWVGEFRKEAPNWEYVVTVLRKALVAAHHFASPHLGFHATKALSIVLDEHLGNRKAAITALDEGRILFGDHPILIGQLANLHFHHNEFAAALALWNQSLSDITGRRLHGIRDPFAFRLAGIAAGKIGEFGQAAELFLSGSHFSREAGVTHTATALLYDAAYCFFKAKRFSEMCKAMRDGLPYLQESPDPEGNPQGFALQKFAGHIVLWILHEVTGKSNKSLAEPALGCSSNPSFDRSISQLPPSRWELTAVNLVELEHRLRFSPETMKTFGSILRDCQVPSAELRLAFVDIDEVYRQARFTDLPTFLEALGLSLARVRAQLRQQQDIQSAFRGEIEDQDRFDILPGYYLLLALTAHILSGGNAHSLIQSWTESVRQLPSLQSAGTIDTLLEAIIAATKDAENTLRDTNRDSYSRLVAAHVILTSLAITPALSAQAQVAYLAWFSASHAQHALREVIPVLCASFARTWQYHLRQPALLLSPRLAVPAIESALASTSDDSQKLHDIIVAASNATRVRVPSALLKWLQDQNNASVL